MKTFPVRIRNAAPARAKQPTRFCRTCFIERSRIERQSDDELRGECQDCHESKRHRP